MLHMEMQLSQHILTQRMIIPKVCGFKQSKLRNFKVVYMPKSQIFADRKIFMKEVKMSATLNLKSRPEVLP